MPLVNESESLVDQFFLTELERETLCKAVVSAHFQSVCHSRNIGLSPRSKYTLGDIHNDCMDMVLEEFCAKSKHYSYGVIKRGYPFVYAESEDAIIQLRRTKGELSIFQKPSVKFNQLRYNSTKQLPVLKSTPLPRVDFLNHGKLFACLVHHVDCKTEGFYLKIPHSSIDQWQYISENILEMQPAAKRYETEIPRTDSYDLRLKFATIQKGLDL
tara:strand:+ start:105 stop:746 length:642 start_codon:yes stop_codon:yes gene_type:complete